MININLRLLMLTTGFIAALWMDLGGQEVSSLLVDIDWEDRRTFELLEFSDAEAWSLNVEDDNHFMSLDRQSDYHPPVRSPLNIALLRGYKLGSFVLELDMKQTGREYGHRDMCLFFGVQDTSDFYYVHLASQADEHAHSIFLVNDSPRVAIAKERNDGIEWGSIWNRVRIERKLDEGSIKVFFNNMDKPIMTTSDDHFDYGYLGFGSFDDTGQIDNIKIWSEDYKLDYTTIFKISKD